MILERLGLVIKGQECTFGVGHRARQRPYSRAEHRSAREARCGAGDAAISPPIADVACANRLSIQVLRFDRSDAGLAALAAWLTLVFSAKESLFKALFPGIGRYFDFLDVGVASVSVPRGALALSLRRPLVDDWPAGRIVEVAFDEFGEAVFTLCVVPAGAQPAPGAFSA